MDSAATILIIEDNDEVREVTTQILTMQGFSVLETDNGANGLALARRERPDVILCDIMMPHMDGFDLLEKIRAIPETASIPFLFVTGRGTAQDQRRGMNLGADDYITKPFRATELVEAIQGRLRRHRNLLAQYSSPPPKPIPETPVPVTKSLTETLASARQGILFRIELLTLDDVLLALGEEVAAASVERVGELIRERCQNATVFHLPGRGYYCVAEGISEEQGLKLGREILSSVRAPLEIHGHRLHLTATLGLARFPEQGQDAGSLTASADCAARMAVGMGSAIEVFSEEMRESASKSVSLSARIIESLEAGHFELHFQPILDMQKQLVSAEALVRWNHPQLGRIAPFLFIPVAETTGDIIELGGWILREACMQLAEFRRATGRNLRVNINLSMRQFAQDNLLDLFHKSLAESQLPGNCVTLEITESLLARNVSRTKHLLQELRDTGARIAIDDFGTGYSSLAYLNQFPLDDLKIDRSLVKDFEATATTRTIVESMIEMAHKLQLSVTAEGVETLAQFDILHALNSDFMQGYLFSEPLSATDFLAYASAP